LASIPGLHKGLKIPAQVKYIYNSDIFSIVQYCSAA
jgi:hypothetical protein